MANDNPFTLDRRALITRTVPACAMAWLGLCKFPEMGICDGDPQEQQAQHKFDLPKEMTLSERQRSERENRAFFRFIKTLREELGEPETVRLLNENSAEYGRAIGEMQAGRTSDRSLQTFVAQFRPPRYSSILTHEVVEDSEKAFELRVSECLIAETFQAAGLGGAIGHAAVCNMDYYWPTAFNPDLKMERTKTLMQGDDHCNHRYIDTA
jgi:hypothetical protein